MIKILILGGGFVPILYPDLKDRGPSIAKQSGQNRGSSISDQIRIWKKSGAELTYYG